MRLGAVFGLLLIVPLGSQAKEHECRLEKNGMFSDGFEVAAEPRTLVFIRTISRGDYRGRKLSACRIELNCDIPAGTKKFGYDVPRAGVHPGTVMIFRPGDLVRVDEKACSITRVVPGNSGTAYLLPLPAAKRRELFGPPTAGQ